VRRFKPDWTVIWGAGVGNSVSIREAIRHGVSLDHLVSVIWIAEKDMHVVGDQRFLA
jgi:branched-chain amino acid transport system substrate-binding protein